jgi:hypothetical protein
MGPTRRSRGSCKAAWRSRRAEAELLEDHAGERRARSRARFSSSERWRRERFFLAQPCSTWPLSSPLMNAAADFSLSWCSAGIKAWSASMAEDDMARAPRRRRPLPRARPQGAGRCSSPGDKAHRGPRPRARPKTRRKRKRLPLLPPPCARREIEGSARPVGRAGGGAGVRDSDRWTLPISP